MLKSRRSFRSLVPGSLILLTLALLLSSCEDTITYAPIIDLTVSKVVPHYGSPGTRVTIEGVGFGSDRRGVTLKVGGVEVEPMRFEDRIITFRVPEGITAGGIYITRSEGSSSIHDYADFTLVPSPYRYDAFQVRFSGALERNRHEYTTSNGENDLGADTAEVSFDRRGQVVGDPAELTCNEFSNGDTIRICSHRLTNARYENRDAYERYDEREACEAVVDSVRKIITSLQVHSSRFSVKQISTLSTSATQAGTLLVLKDLPYTIGTEGRMEVSLQGEELRRHIVSYSNSYSHNTKDATGWSNENIVAEDLVEFPDEAVFSILLYQKP